MKKNVMMRLACFLLVAVLISTSTISGTYAKYTTQDAGNDSARVAKWGVEVQVIGNLYGDSYGANDKIVLDTDAGVTVQSFNKSDDVVAPGTKNEEGFTFSLTGKPEVDGIVTTTMTVQNIFLKQGTYGLMIPVDAGVVTEANFDEFVDDLYVKNGVQYEKATAWADVAYYTLEDKVEVGFDYYPVEYKLVGGTTSNGTNTADSLKKAADAIAGNLGLTAGAAAPDTSITYTGVKSFESNTDLAGWNVTNQVLTWTWAFGDENKVGDVHPFGDGVNDAQATDGADTILGNLMTAKQNGNKVVDGEVVKLDGTSYVAPEQYTDYCLDTQFSIDITVTQVD